MGYAAATADRKGRQAVAALVPQITVIGWLPAAIWALFVVNNRYADRRANRLLDALARQRRASD